ncbi:MFS transporter [Streptosporangium algeriense]|uniref:MFS transporter n=1 Tax=Streptosporangium algeriense TaxID=1682748 RepID=A0ABW3DT32_9ACTN
MTAITRPEGNVAEGFPDRGFTAYWSAIGVSQFGTAVSMVTIPLIAVLTIGATPEQMTWLVVMELAPALLTGVPAAAWADTLHRRLPPLIGCNVVQALVVGAIPLLWWLGSLDYPALLVLVGVSSLVRGLQSALAGPILVQTVPREHLVDANGKTNATRSVADIGGPAAGGMLTAVLAAPLVILVDAVSFLLSALLVRSLPAVPPPTGDGRESLLRQARAGASYVFRDRLLLGLALRPAVGNVAFLAVETVLALFAHERLGVGTFGFGLLLTAEACGGLLGAGIASFLGRRLGTGTALTCTATVEGLAILGLATAPDPYLAGLALAVCGAGIGATMVLGPSLRQAIVPARLMGRVASTSRMLAMCAAPFGAFLGGWLATTYGIRTPIYAAGGLLLAMTAVTATMTSNRRVEAALHRAASTGGSVRPQSGDPLREDAPDLQRPIDVPAR